MTRLGRTLMTKRKSSSPIAMGPRQVVRPARIPTNMSALHHDRLALGIGQGFDWSSIDLLFSWDQAQLFKFPSYHQGCLCFGSPILTLRQIVERRELVIS